MASANRLRPASASALTGQVLRFASFQAGLLSPAQARKPCNLHAASPHFQRLSDASEPRPRNHDGSLRFLLRGVSVMTLLRVRLRKPLIAASFLALAAASPALAQTWVDPPARVEAPSQPSLPRRQRLKQFGRLNLRRGQMCRRLSQASPPHCGKPTGPVRPHRLVKPPRLAISRRQVL